MGENDCAIFFYNKKKIKCVRNIIVLVTMTSTNVIRFLTKKIFKKIIIINLYGGWGSE